MNNPNIGFTGEDEKKIDKENEKRISNKTVPTRQQPKKKMTKQETFNLGLD